MATMASEVKFGFIFEIGNHNYPGIHVHIMPITATLVASEAMAASKQLRSQMASMNSITYVSMSLWPLKASIGEATNGRTRLFRQDFSKYLRMFERLDFNLEIA